MGGLSIKKERDPYLRTFNDKDPRCKVRFKRVWSQTEIDIRKSQNQMIGQIMWPSK
jgi:hypothetical protein